MSSTTPDELRTEPRADTRISLRLSRDRHNQLTDDYGSIAPAIRDAITHVLDTDTVPTWHSTEKPGADLSNTPTERITVRIPSELEADLDAVVDDNDRSRSRLLRDALRDLHTPIDPA